MTTQPTNVRRRSAVPTSTARQLYQQCIQLADSIAESQRSTPAQRASARRARDQLAARLRMGPALTANATEPEPVFLGVSAPRAVKPGGVFIRLAEEYRESSNPKGNLRRGSRYAAWSPRTW